MVATYPAGFQREVELYSTETIEVNLFLFLLVCSMYCNNYWISNIRKKVDLYLYYYYIIYTYFSKKWWAKGGVRFNAPPPCPVIFT